MIDMSRVMAGPWAGQALADLGADVIHVERPIVGDDTRTWGPPYLHDSEGGKTRESAYYLSANRNKRSVTADFSNESDREFIRELIKTADVVIENFKVGKLAEFGLSYEDLKQINPRLIMCSITGFGQDGPRSPQAAYDFGIQGLGGLMSVTGLSDEDGGMPTKVGIPIVDLVTGLYATIGVLAALQRRSVTGEGEYVDVAMLDSLLAVMSNQAMNYLVGGYIPQRRGNEHPNIQPQDAFATADGYIIIASGNDEGFRKLAQVLGRPELADDVRFKDNPSRIANLVELDDTIRPILATQPTAHWLSALEEIGVPCGPINDIASALTDVQVVHRGQVTEIDHPVSGTVPTVLPPYRFLESPLSVRRHPPLLGEHDEEIRRELANKTQERR